MLLIGRRHLLALLPALTNRRSAVAPLLLVAMALMVSGCALFGGDDTAAGDEANSSATPATTAPDAATTEPPAEGATPEADDETAAEVDDNTATEGEGAGGETAEGEPFTVAPVVWDSCGGQYECGAVEVPVDHAQPTGDTMSIALVRLPATGERKGSIFVNPGGPGASGVDYVRGGFSFDAATMEIYDLVGFDPRGIGGSDRLECSLDRSSGPMPDFSPDDEAEVAALNDEARSFAESCGSTDSDLLANINTEAVARDLDLARAAVGDDQLHYYGFSYGTLIGQVYADLFGENIGHMVLDGVVDPTQSLSDLLTQQAVAFEESFVVLDEACGRRLSCPDGGVIEIYDRLLADLEASGPIGEVGPAEFEFAALVTLYSERLWPTYVSALEQADGGDLAGIESLSDLFVSGVSFAAYAAVECTDGGRPEGPDAWDRFADELASAAPRFGAAVANELRTCAFWPVEAGDDRAPVQAPGSGPIIVIGNTNDPATPLANARLVAENLDQASLVVVEADRHTAYRGSPCVQALVSSYFVDDVIPPSLTNCDG